MAQQKNEEIEQKQNEQPDVKIRVGNISIAGWEHQSEKGSWVSYTMQRSYKDKEDEWKNTGSFRRDDIPKLILALQTAYKESYEKGEKSVEE